MMKIEDSFLSRLVGKVIKLRMAKRKVEDLAAVAADLVIAQLNIRKTDTWKAPAGDVTKYSITPRSLDPEILFNRVGKEAFRVMSVNAGQAVEMFGETLLKGLIKEGEASERLLSKPAKEEQRVVVKCP